MDDPSRVLIQVGLRSTARRPGQRPPMTAALVLDLRAGDPDGLQRALAQALVAERRAGDRLSLWALGAAEPRLAGPEDLRAGFVSVALDDALAADPTAEAPSSERVVAAALAELGAGTDDEALLGTRALVLAASAPLTDGPRDLVPAIHHAAVEDGISTGTLAVGAGAPVAQLDLLSAAGQGGRRILLERGEAAALVSSELDAGADVVARALRLRIRLAPGVRLVGLPGSHRLGAREATRAREVERALDQRLARERGLEIDREEDEDGIRILIPAFRADDWHTVLLDVVVPGPGPVAEVTLRSKDLVAGRNGVQRDQLELPRGEGRRGALELAVWKSLVGQRLHLGLDRAADALDAGDRDGALERVDGLRSLLRGLPAIVPGLAGDVDLARDLELLDRAAELVSGVELGPRDASVGPADALRLAAARRWLHLPLDSDEGEKR